MYFMCVNVRTREHTHTLLSAEYSVWTSKCSI